MLPRDGPRTGSATRLAHHDHAHGFTSHPLVAGGPDRVDGVAQAGRGVVIPGEDVEDSLPQENGAADPGEVVSHDPGPHGGVTDPELDRGVETHASRPFTRDVSHALGFPFHARSTLSVRKTETSNSLRVAKSRTAFSNPGASSGSSVATVSSV